MEPMYSVLTISTSVFLMLLICICIRKALQALSEKNQLRIVQIARIHSQGLQIAYDLDKTLALLYLEFQQEANLLIDNPRMTLAFEDLKQEAEDKANQAISEAIKKFNQLESRADKLQTPGLLDGLIEQFGLECRALQLIKENC